MDIPAIDKAKLTGRLLYIIQELENKDVDLVMRTLSGL